MDRKCRAVIVLVALGALVVARSLAAAEAPVMVKDVFAGTASSLALPATGVATPRTLVRAGELVFFAADDGTAGRELWRSDGTGLGTFRVKDVFPGPGSSSPQTLAAVGDSLFFSADDGTSGRELWRSDGTEAGTFRVKDIASGPAGSFVEEIAAVGETAFFAAHDGTGYALWRSDGTEAGTVLVERLGNPRQLVAAGGLLFFVASDLTSGRELWRSDGTESGTFRVRDLVPGSGSPSILDSLFPVGGTLFFRAWPGSTAPELWRSDGTEVGTVRVKRVFLSPPHGGVACATAPLSHMAASGGTLFFSADDEATPGQELWRSDGTEAGTIRVKDIAPGTASSNPQCLVVAGGALYFAATDGTGAELWRSDGTETGTVRVRDIVPGLGGSGPHFLTEAGGALFFSASATFGTELWRSDGTEAGTAPVADIRAGAASSSPQSLIAVGERLFFTADDGTHGRELWAFALASAPVADAGPDQTVAEGTAVSLDGSGSGDPNGDSLGYDWEQIAGPGVTLSDATSARPGFTAPGVPLGGATLTFRLTVSDGTQASAPDTVDVTVTNVNRVPVADAGDDQAVQEESLVTLHGADSFDPDGEPLTWQWTQTGGTAVALSDPAAPEPTFTAPLVGVAGETLAFVLTVSDGTAQATDEVLVALSNVNHVPTADAGPDQTVDEGAAVTLEGSASSDPDADPLTWAWTQVSGAPVTLADSTSATPTFTGPQVGPGGDALVFQLVVSDGSASSPPDLVTITVRDANQPPSCELARASTPVLWPPNHKLLAVEIEGVADAEDPDVTVTVTAVSQDEPVNGLGDGDTSPDAVPQGSSLLLRAERAGGGTGRVYTVAFTATDASGATCAGTVTVCVPHDPRTDACADDGQAHDSRQP